MPAGQKLKSRGGPATKDNVPGERSRTPWPTGLKALSAFKRNQQYGQVPGVFTPVSGSFGLCSGLRLRSSASLPKAQDDIGIRFLKPTRRFNLSR